ncbi:hypothetical protein LCGC14_1347520 [marine sediment metagenome]|uniref:Uncharacterized protein n=1 Tax=marine sediment metagenome TaxID=412755 RepID=A0A0F9NE50_9ZZZZ
MSHTAKLVDARDRIKAFAMKQRDEADRIAERSDGTTLTAAIADPIINGFRSQAHGLDLAVRVIEDLLQD